MFEQVLDTPMCTNLTGTECKSYISGSDCEVKNGLCTVVYLFKNNSICVSQGKRYWITKTCDYFWPIFVYQRMQCLFILCDFLLFLIKNIFFFFPFFVFYFICFWLYTVFHKTDQCYEFHDERMSLTIHLAY